MLAASGCEYFTSERLARLTPGKAADPAAKLGIDPTAPNTPVVTDPATGEPVRLTAAEVVTMLERIIRGNQHELDDLAPKVDEHEEAEQARDVFQHLDDLLKSLDREKKKAVAAHEPERVAEIERQATNLKEPWNLARERLNLDLRARMLMLERISILKSVLAHDRERLAAVLATGDLARFLDESKPAAAPVAAPAAPAEAAATPAPPPSGPPNPAPAAVQIPIIPGQPLVPKAVDPKDVEKTKDAAKPEAAKTDAEKKAEAESKGEAPAKAAAAPNKELISAKQELDAKSTAVQKLQERTMTLDARMQNLARSIELVKELVEVSQQSVDNATKTREYLVREMQEGKPSAAVQAWTHDGGDALGAMDRRIRTASEDVKQLKNRFEEMVEERALVVDALQRTSLRAQSAQEGLEKTQETVEALESPFSTHNMKAWLFEHGPPIVATLIVMSLLYLLVSRYAQKVVELFASRGLRGSKAERDNRMDTLVSVLQNTGSVVVLLGGISTLLSQVGIPVAPLLGGAAVAGVAVAFGAQNLIKDFFYGFMILLENQYKLKDVVKIGDHSGQVEQITLRMTALRDGDGALHFLPNGATTSVVNMTHGWSSASFAVRIAWEEDVDRVIAIIQDLGKELRQDPNLRLMIVDDLNMMGVDALTDSAAVILFSIKTLPLQQWNVKREFLRRLKKRFQEKKVLLPPPSPPAAASS
ncbi:mechanosensitive ion channel family protein [Paludisphaera mucosa]|uniref:Mechanosensitive ion channel n=1 Tax=Paludisphaera mucosa TaxID=3030827 RepID=A0ABT6FH55_9BACT|nr:mechanosensitive ion channel domain-containing protein [Paludisphaera mucosa]MDG3006859.1 mechanosensitive ion channel [Paludisphaera mucosa]